MSRDHDYLVYIATNDTNTVLYIGIVSAFQLAEHRRVGGPLDPEQASKSSAGQGVDRFKLVAHPSIL